MNDVRVAWGMRIGRTSVLPYGERAKTVADLETVQLGMVWQDQWSAWGAAGKAVQIPGMGYPLDKDTGLLLFTEHIHGKSNWGDLCPAISGKGDRVTAKVPHPPFKSAAENYLREMNRWAVHRHVVEMKEPADVARFLGYSIYFPTGMVDARPQGIYLRSIYRDAIEHGNWASTLPREIHLENKQDVTVKAEYHSRYIATKNGKAVFHLGGDGNFSTYIPEGMEPPKFGAVIKPGQPLLKFSKLGVNGAPLMAKAIDRIIQSRIYAQYNGRLLARAWDALRVPHVCECGSEVKSMIGDLVCFRCDEKGDDSSTVTEHGADVECSCGYTSERSNFQRHTACPCGRQRVPIVRKAYVKMSSCVHTAHLSVMEGGEYLPNPLKLSGVEQYYRELQEAGEDVSTARELAEKEGYAVKIA